MVAGFVCLHLELLQLAEIVVDKCVSRFQLDVHVRGLRALLSNPQYLTPPCRTGLAVAAFSCKVHTFQQRQSGQHGPWQNQYLRPCESSRKAQELAASGQSEEPGTQPCHLKDPEMQGTVKKPSLGSTCSSRFSDALCGCPVLLHPLARPFQTPRSHVSFRES